MRLDNKGRWINLKSFIKRRKNVFREISGGNTFLELLVF